jgi:hypothetical protein
VLGWEWDDSAVVHELPALIESKLGIHGGGPSRMTYVLFRIFGFGISCSSSFLISSFISMLHVSLTNSISQTTPYRASPTPNAGHRPFPRLDVR